MKINFDSLFEEQIRNKNQKIIRNTFSFEKEERKHQISTYSILTQDTSPKRNRSIVREAQEVKNLLETRMQEILKSKTNNSQIVFTKKKKTVNVKELTERIYQPPACNKKYCKQLQLLKSKNEILEQLQTKRQFRANQSYHNLHQNRGNIHERLHNQSKFKALRMYQKNNQMVESKDSTIPKGSKKYAKNYIPFYQRLQSIISKSQQKKKFLESNPHLDFNSKQKYFAPSLFKSQQYKDIQPRYLKDLSHSRLDCSFEYQDTLNTSFQSISSLDKSVQLVNGIQQYFFNRMECIFVNRETDQVDITQQNVNLLSSVEFKIMQDFIIELESNPIEANFFYDKLQTYYENLDFRDKQELRVHQSKLKKYSKNRSKAKQQKKQKTLAKPSSKNAKNFEKDLLFV